jgi:hypothetical protein
MSPEELQKQMDAGNVKMVAGQQTPDTPKTPPNPLDEYQSILDTLRRPRKHLTVAPTFTPKSFIDQIQLFDDGVNRRLYLYVNKVWRYVALT